MVFVGVDSLSNINYKGLSLFLMFEHKYRDQFEIIHISSSDGIKLE